MKKLICYICASLGIVMAIYFVTVEHSVWLFAEQALPCIAIFIAVPFCKSILDYRVTTFFSIWIAGYNLAFVIFKLIGIIDLYTVPYHIILQYFVPLMFSVISKIVITSKSQK